MSDDDKGNSKSLEVPTSGRPSRTVTPAGSAASSRNVSPAGHTRAQSTPAQLSTELILKVQAQKARLTLMKELQDNLPSSKEELLEYKGHIDETFKMFFKVHSYFETVWPADCLDHEYFSNDWYLDAQRIYTSLTREIAKLRSSFPSESASSSVHPDTTPHTKLPDISLLEFKGEYSEWPTFSDLFKSLIIDNSKLSDMERLHYLRGCLKDALSQLIASLPLTGASLTQSWDLLTSRYENKRLIVQSHFDKLFGITTAQKNSSSLNLLITTVSETHKALLNLGVTTTLGDNMMVYHVSKHLDPAIREAWELSLLKGVSLVRKDELIFDRSSEGSRKNRGSERNRLTDTLTTDVSTCKGSKDRLQFTNCGIRS